MAPQVKLPRIITPLPGPRAAAIVADDQRYVSPSYTRSYPLVASKGFGAIVEDVDGNLFLDFSAGIAVCSSGHCHPDVVRAIQEQSARLIHMSGTDFYYQQMPALARKLESLMPHGGQWKCFFGNSGTEAVEAAMELAKLEGIIPALETAHALHSLRKIQFAKDDIVVVNLSGRGDKDLATYMKFI